MPPPMLLAYSVRVQGARRSEASNGSLARLREFADPLHATEARGGNGKAGND